MAELERPPARFVLVTGTDTGVGKTVTTAALAVRHLRAGRSIVVVKATQTGVAPGAEGDVDVVRRLSGAVHTVELVRLGAPLAPESAARRAGTELPTAAELAGRIVAAAAATGADVVLIEGAGGVAVRIDLNGATVLDLGRALAVHGDVHVVVVAHAGLGTLNHTALTVSAIHAAGLAIAGLVIGSWPAVPDLAATVNRDDLPRVTGLPLLAAVPAGAGGLPPEEFRRQAPGWYDRSG